MENKKTDPILMTSAVIALICTVYVLYITVFEQIISQNQGFFYAVIFGFILLVLFLLCNLFTKLIAISGTEQQSSYHRLVVAIGLVVAAGLFLVTRMRYYTSLSPDDSPIYRGAVAMVDGTYSQSHDLINLANANPGQYLYSLILSVVFRIVTPDARAFMWVNAFFIILCGYLTFRIVRKFTNSMCGLFAVALCALIPSQTFAVYSFSSEPMVAAFFLGAALSLISLVSYDKHVKEQKEGWKDRGGIAYTIIGSLLIGIIIFVEPFMIIPVALVVLFSAISHNPKTFNMLIAFAAGLVILILMCFVKSTHMGVDLGTVFASELSAFDPSTNANTGQVSEFSDVYHSFNAELSTTDRNVTDNYMFISESEGTVGMGVYSDLSISWVIVLNQILYMFILMMTISCIILAVKEQKDYVITISMLIVGAVVMLMFQQNRESQKFLFITVFIIASSTGIHYLYLDHHPELKVGVNALDALEKTGRKEMAAATRSNLKNAAQMSEGDFVKRAKALIFIGSDEDLYRKIKDEEHKLSLKYGRRQDEETGALDDYDEDFFLDSEDNSDLDVKVTTVTPTGISQTVGRQKNVYEPNAEMHASANSAYNNSPLPAWKRPERFGDDELFDEDEVGVGQDHSEFDGRDKLVTGGGLTTDEPEPVVEKIKRNVTKIDLEPDHPGRRVEAEPDIPKVASARAKKVNMPVLEKPLMPEPQVEEPVTGEALDSEPVTEKAVKKKGIKEKPAKEKTVKEKPVKEKAESRKHKGFGQKEAALPPGKSVRRIKTVGSGPAKTVSIATDVAPSKPLPNPLPTPKKKPHKDLDYDKKLNKSSSNDDWDFDYDVSSDDDWDV
ncbi:MAG: hypothetical protein K6F28_06865 [Lachnospiraceae bacterium]|nr:hypothetical protein [Lachnospiraceae bacterium]